MKDLSKGSPIELAETLKTYHNSSKFRVGLQFYKSRISPIDIQNEIWHTLGIIGGKQTKPPSYRKEEVMSQMDSSNKPSAVASLLN